MKISDLDYFEVLYNDSFDVSDEIAKLNHTQRYVQLSYDDQLYNLKIIGIDDDRFIVEIDGLVQEGIK